MHWKYLLLQPFSHSVAATITVNIQFTVFLLHFHCISTVLSLYFYCTFTVLLTLHTYTYLQCKHLQPWLLLYVYLDKVSSHISSLVVANACAPHKLDMSYWPSYLPSSRIIAWREKMCLCQVFIYIQNVNW